MPPVFLYPEKDKVFFCKLNRKLTRPFCKETVRFFTDEMCNKWEDYAGKHAKIVLTHLFGADNMILTVS